MDSKDFRLLAALHENARQSYRRLGQHVSLSAPAVRDRLKRLEDRRILHGYWTYVDPAVFQREDLLVFFNGNWNRYDIIDLLSLPDVAFAAWKVDGGATVQLWPENPSRSLDDLAGKLGTRPSGRAYSAPNRIPEPSVAGWRIIGALLEDPRMPLSLLVEKTGLSSKTVRAHLNRLVQTETVYILPRLGSLADAGELVYNLAVFGRAEMNELRQALGDIVLVGSTDEPEMKYLLCRASDLADITARTGKAGKLPGVNSVTVTLNRELFPNNDFVHSLVRAKMKLHRERTSL